MNFIFDEEQQMIFDTAHDFATEILKPRVEEIEKAEKFPEDIFKSMAEVGFFGLNFPEKYGGMEMGHTAQNITIEEVSKISASTGTVICVTLLPLEAINMYGNEEQKEKYLVPGIQGEFIGSFAFTEAGTGSDPKQLISTAKKVGDKYILNGVKRFISNAAYPGPMVVFANEEETGECTAFIVNKFCEGYSISTPWDKVGFHGSHIYDVFLEDVEVSEEDILGTSGQGFDILIGTTTYGKLAFSAVFTGNMGGAYDLAVKYAKEKLHRGKPISKFPTIKSKVAQIASNYESTKLLLYKVCEIADTEKDLRKVQSWTSLIKGHVADLGIETNVMAMNILASYGVTDEYHVERFVRDSLIGPNIEGSAEIQRLIAGGYILK